MIKIYDADMRTASTSRNLRGLLEYTRKNEVERVDIWPNKNGAQFGVTWRNGASCMSDFADSTVCKAFFAKRKAFNHNIIIHEVKQ